jgi:hypothetical protein
MAANFFRIWCGEGDLFLAIPLTASKLYQTRRTQFAESSTRTALSHTSSHTPHAYDVVNAETSDRAEYRAASCEESLQKS